jgi:hypothetical protein
MYREKKGRIIDRIEDIHRSKEEFRVAELVYLTTLNANIDRQTTSYDLEEKTALEANVDFETTPNPYEFNHPVYGSQFHGRRLELSNLRRAVMEGRSIGIFGFERIGKTSLVRHGLEKDSAIAEKYLVVYIDMFVHHGSLLSYKQFLSAILRSIWSQYGITEYSELYKKLEEYLSSDDAAELMTRFRSAMIEVLKLYAGKKNGIILIFDEFQNIGKTFRQAIVQQPRNPVDPSLVRFFSSLVKDGVIQVVICSRYQFIDMDREYKFELLKLVNDYWLGTFNFGASRAVIKEPSAGVLRWEQGAVDEILKMTGGHPYLIQYLCYAVFEEAKTNHQKTVSKPMVNTLCNRLVREPHREAKLRVLYEDFKEVQKGAPLDMLLIIAHSSKKYQQPVSFDTIHGTFSREFGGKGNGDLVRSAMEPLLMSSIVMEKADESGMMWYHISPDLLRRWIRSHNHYYKRRSEIQMNREA